MCFLFPFLPRILCVLLCCMICTYFECVSEGAVVVVHSRPAAEKSEEAWLAGDMHVRRLFCQFFVRSFPIEYSCKPEKKQNQQRRQHRSQRHHTYLFSKPLVVLRSPFQSNRLIHSTDPNDQVSSTGSILAEDLQARGRHRAHQLLGLLLGVFRVGPRADVYAAVRI